MRTPPEWIERWLEIPFYEGEKCRMHQGHSKTVYCATCMEDICCRICWKKGEHHGDGHQTLRVTKAAHKPAIRVRYMRKFMEVSDIQVYIFNRKRVVHLTPKSGAYRAQPDCKTCGRKLIASHYNFCSIACKVQYRGDDLENKKEGEVEDEGSSGSSDDDLIVNGDELEVGGRSPSPSPSPPPNKLSVSRIKMETANSSVLRSKRRRSRKGIPRRAPIK